MTEINNEMDTNYKQIFNVDETKYEKKKNEDNIAQAVTDDQGADDEAIDELINNILKDATEIIENENIELRKSSDKESYIMKNGKKKSIKKGKDVVGEKLNKVDHFIIKNNKNAIENLETIVLEMQELYNKRIEEVEKKLKEMEVNHKKELLNKNIECEKENYRNRRKS